MATLIPATTRRPRPEETAASRPLALVSVVGGLAAALIGLCVCLTAGMIGWYLSDSGAHGAPRDGLQAGALGWLLAHRSAITVDGVAITMVPLAITLGCVIVLWKVASRVGDRVSGHGPDADRIADGERDWTVPAATTLMAVGYGAVVFVTDYLVGHDRGLSTFRLLTTVVTLAVLVILPAVAIGSGRAAVWAAPLPPSVVVGFLTARAIMRTFLWASAALLVVALAMHVGTVMNIVSQLDLNKGGTVAYVLATLLVTPNALLFSSAYLLGPGFAAGAGTVVAPTGVVLGALPLIPWFGALPGAGPTPGWLAALLAVPVLVAAWATARVQQRHPSVRWEESLARALGGAVTAGLVVGLLVSLAGGAIGPARMQVVAPYAFDVLVYAVTLFGLGGLIGAVAMTWWQRRALRSGTL